MIQGPYATRIEGGRLVVDYTGNQLFEPIADVFARSYDLAEFAGRVGSFARNKHWDAIDRLNGALFTSAVEYFTELGAIFVPLPLTTRMISSPGALLGPKQISYTTDTSPVSLQWFDDDRLAFLSESSQIYLELSLVKSSVSQVFSIYNSFRKEQSDATHLAEFHHIEYEGKVEQSKNLTTAVGLIAHICHRLVTAHEPDLAFFLSSSEVQALGDFANERQVHRLRFSDALDALYRDTGDARFKFFTLKNTLGAAEEVRLSEICGGVVAVTHYPLLQVPFYHAQVPASEPAVAENADLLWPGYREVLGSGERISSLTELMNKAELFELPPADYEPYLQSRRLSTYERTSGFGLGWERLMQGVLRAPSIWSCVPFPRVSGGITP